MILTDPRKLALLEKKYEVSDLIYKFKKLRHMEYNQMFPVLFKTSSELRLLFQGWDWFRAINKSTKMGIKNIPQEDF